MGAEVAEGNPGHWEDPGPPSPCRPFTSRCQPDFAGAEGSNPAWGRTGENPRQKEPVSLQGPAWS